MNDDSTLDAADDTLRPSPYDALEHRCPSCGYGSDDRKEFASYFCPSYPDKCAGCEMHEDRMHCPECDHEWELR